MLERGVIMNLFELMKYRRSIRKYEDKQIPRMELEKIMEAGSTRPTPAADNGQLSAPFTTRNFVKKSEN